MSGKPPTAEERARPRPRFAKLQAALGILLSMATLGWLIYATDWADVWMSVKEADYRLVAMALALNLTSVLLRTIRWRSMFHSHPLPRFGRLSAALLIGQAVNLLAPARLGDLARATLVNTQKTAYTLGTLMVEASLDVLMLVALVILLLFQATLPDWWRGSGRALLGTAGVALTAVTALVVGRGWVVRALERLADRHPALQHVTALAKQLLLGLDTLGRPVQLAPVLAWSVSIWVLYSAVNYVLLAAVGETPSILTALFLLVVLQIGVAVPSSPGRIGVFHYLCVQALGVFGIGGGKALSYAVILHLISVVVPVALGSALAWRWGVSSWLTTGDEIDAPTRV